jgi:hypothetical protein
MPEKAPFESLHFLILCISMVLLLTAGWLGFCLAILKSGGNFADIWRAGFLENLTVSLVVIATTTLGLAGVLKGDLVATLFGGIVGYVLGNVRRRRQPGQPPPKSLQAQSGTDQAKGNSGATPRGNKSPEAPA